MKLVPAFPMLSKARIVKKKSILNELEYLSSKAKRYLSHTNQGFVCVAMAVPLRGKYSNRVTFSRVIPHIGGVCSSKHSTHAEENLMKTLDVNIKYDILVLRVSNKGNITCARPCVRCIDCHISRASNIRKIHYSDYDGNIRTERYEELINSKFKYVCNKYP